MIIGIFSTSEVATIYLVAYLSEVHRAEEIHDFREDHEGSLYVFPGITKLSEAKKLKKLGCAMVKVSYLGQPIVEREDDLRFFHDWSAIVLLGTNTESTNEHIDNVLRGYLPNERT